MIYRKKVVLAVISVVSVAYLLTVSRSKYHGLTLRQQPIRKIGVCPPVDWSSPRYCIQINENKSSVGDSFNLSQSYLKQLKIPLDTFEPLLRSNLNDFVFVTAADGSHYFPVAMDAIGNVQRLLPNHTIYFYDLATNTNHSRIEKLMKLCNVIYRKFDYSRYPSHVKYLKNYSFKPLIVHEMLREFSRVFWMDSSIRWKTGHLTLTLDEVFHSGGILLFSHSGHNNFQATHSQMYRYLPIPVSAAIGTAQNEANSIYIHRNTEVYNRIIVWWVLCALQEDCMAPTLQLDCNFTAANVWAQCHRYDQSALNILLANHYRYHDEKYRSRHGQLGVHRRSANQEKVVVCSTTTTTRIVISFDEIK